MAAGQTQVSKRSQPFYIYGGLPCNSLMAGEFRFCINVFVSLVSDSWSDRTPLHESACQGRLLHIKTLITQGLHVDTLTIDRVSPLHEACLGGHYACAKLLLDNGANAVSADGATPLFNSCRSGSAACVRLLSQHGASSLTTSQLASPIHEAASKDHRECLELLLSHGASIDVELPEVGSPLYCACKAGSTASVELLLRSGADVSVGCGRDSPLHAAVQAGESDVVEVLLDFGADRFSRNTDGKSPLDLSAPDSSVRLVLQKRGLGSLSRLCRSSIRRSLGRSRLHRASILFLPHTIKDFLLYH
uniref:Ankyrin repeat and SOCS box protein 11 n=1 Tax=Nothobranchius furzeri TaxID=105023 RepID=A0A8C6NLM5_NOTFU